LRQPEKTASPIEGAFPKKHALFKPLQSATAKSPMLVTLLGMVTLVKLVQPMNALIPMLTTLLPIVTLVKPVQI